LFLSDIFAPFPLGKTSLLFGANSAAFRLDAYFTVPAVGIARDVLESRKQDRIRT
jgi:hypothetical protein